MKSIVEKLFEWANSSEPLLFKESYFFKAVTFFAEDAFLEDPIPEYLFFTASLVFTAAFSIYQLVINPTLVGVLVGRSVVEVSLGGNHLAQLTWRDESLIFNQNFGSYRFLCNYWTVYCLRIHYHFFESYRAVLSKYQKIMTSLTFIFC